MKVSKHHGTEPTNIKYFSGSLVFSTGYQEELLFKKLNSKPSQLQKTGKNEEDKEERSSYAAML
jgi:hypothetical protein